MDRTERLIEKHFHKKPGENLEILQDRYRRIREFHKDSLTAALLATSYYSMEELMMRLPRLNDILRNPFCEEELLHAVTGPIILADGGPAEGAKAIQIYMALRSMGIEPEDAKIHHMISLLAVSSRQVSPLMQELTASLENMLSSDELSGNEVSAMEVSGEKTDKKAAFLKVAEQWIRDEQERQVREMDEEAVAYALLVGMREEVDTLLDEEL